MTPAPLFETDEERIAFVVRLPRQPSATAVDTPQVTPQVGALLSRMDGAMTRQAMQDALGLADRWHFRKSYLVPALEQGVIKMTKPGKLNSRSQRYRLTSLGRQWLDTHSGGGARRNPKECKTAHLGGFFVLFGMVSIRRRLYKPAMKHVY